MPQFEIRCNTERILVVEAADEESARKIAEDTDFSEWDQADSLYEIEPVEGPAEPAGALPPDHSLPHPQRDAEDRFYRLRIDMPLFRLQRELLIKITDLACRSQSYVPAPGDGNLLNGLLELSDALADEHEDGIGS